LASLLASLCVGPRAIAQQAVDEQAYRQTTDEAVREFEAGHWEEARALFKRAHEISPNARTLRGMGMAAFELRMYVQAIRELDAALREQRKPLDAELRAHVQQLMDKAREFVGRVKPVLDPPDAKLLIDGREPMLETDGSVLLDVGTHVISASADHYKPSNVRLAVEGGTDQVLRVPLEPLLAVQAVVPALDSEHPLPAPSQGPAPSPSPQPATTPPPNQDSNLGTYAFIALAGAGAFGIASGVFWLVGDGQYKTAHASCPKNDCPEPQLSSIKTSDILTNVFLGLAAASGVTAGVLFAINAGSGGERDSAPKSSATAPMTVAFHATPTGVLLKGQF
jgi:hypothetical protein